MIFPSELFYHCRDCDYYTLIGTRYTCASIISMKIEIIWHYNYTNPPDIVDTNMDCAWCSTLECNRVSFEKVIDNVSEETQTELLFHLDFFT
jgi:hypothetical protein